MNKVSSILHDHPRTYFHDLLAPDELSALLERGDSFHLEQVADPDAVAPRTDVVIVITRQALAVRCRQATGDASA